MTSPSPAAKQVGHSDFKCQNAIADHFRQMIRGAFQTPRPRETDAFLPNSRVLNQIERLSDSSPAVKPSKRSTTAQNTTLKTRIFLGIGDDGHCCRKMAMGWIERRRRNVARSPTIKLPDFAVECPFCGVVTLADVRCRQKLCCSLHEIHRKVISCVTVRLL